MKGVTMATMEIGPGQIKVLRILWNTERATAQEITDIMNESEPTKLSTVQTFLRALVKKGIAGYDVDNRTYVFFPLVDETQVKNSELKGFLERSFSGSANGMVAYLVENSFLDPEELRKIYELFEEKKDD